MTCPICDGKKYVIKKGKKHTCPMCNGFGEVYGESK